MITHLKYIHTPLLLAILFTLTTTLQSTALQSNTNLLPNPSFEENNNNQISGWQFFAWRGKQNANPSITNHARTGKQSLTIQSNKGTDAAWHTFVNVKPHTVYKLSGWIKTKNIKGAVGALLNIQNMQTVKTPPVTGTKDWTHVSTIFRSTNITRLQINCLYGGWGRSTGQAWFDDISLTQADDNLLPKPIKNIPRMLIPGFTIKELPIKLTSLNNIEYAKDGRLFAAGYDGRYHILKDTNNDNLEDKVITFSSKTSPNYPIGMVIKDGEPHVVLTDEIVKFVDTNKDKIPDKRVTVIKGFDDPELVKAKYLHHRRVDSSIALALGPDQAWYITMGNAAPSNPYWRDKQGKYHYNTKQRRGCLLKITPDGKVKQLNSGLRYIMSLQFNKHGDLFGTDQEGATWSPNGNPFDELLHIQANRHYGFPPRHPKFLPDVIDEPSTWNYTPQHQSTCGFRFNTPTKGRGRFGPAFWQDDAIVTGEARGKLWRTKLAKTNAGYVAKSHLFASLNLLVVDCAISPKGDLVICCHTGQPDWGNGPNGQGRLFKISYTNKQAPQPVTTWANSPTQTIIAFDKPLTPQDYTNIKKRITIDSGQDASAGDRFEKMRPGYKVVHYQTKQPRKKIKVISTKLSPNYRNLIITTEPRKHATNYTLTINNKKQPIDLAHQLTGLSAIWHGNNNTKWKGWLPHPDLTATYTFTQSSHTHQQLRKHLTRPGQLTLKTQLDLHNMLQPETQPISKLDYTPTPEIVTLIFKSDNMLNINAPGATIKRISPKEIHLTFNSPTKFRWQPLTLTLNTPTIQLDTSFHTQRDPRPRPLNIQRFLMPFAIPEKQQLIQQSIPQLAGGNWHKGKQLFNTKAACATCHVFRNQGHPVGPELNNLIHRDYQSVLRDIIDPNAAINPDAIAYTVTLKNKTTHVGIRSAETNTHLHLIQPGGSIIKINKNNITKTTPLTQSLMPPGLDKLLNKSELRDLMTYLLLKEPK